MALLNGALEANTTEIESLEDQLEESSKVINSYEDSVNEKQSLLDQVIIIIHLGVTSI